MGKKNKIARRRVQEGTLITAPGKSKDTSAPELIPPESEWGKRGSLEMVPPAHGRRAQEGTLLRKPPVRGATGATGPTGFSTRGATGATGPVGSTGPQGPVGWTASRVSPSPGVVSACEICGLQDATFNVRDTFGEHRSRMLCRHCTTILATSGDL